MQDFLTYFFQQLIQTSPLEWIATISGFLCVYLAAKQYIWNWPISILSVGIYLYIFYQSKLYGDAVLQIYFLSTAVYGWYYWNNGNHTDQRPISSLSPTQCGLVAATIITLSLLIGASLDRWTDSDVPYIDGFCTSMSFVAQFLMTRKVLQNWIIWVVVDICYIPLYIHKDLAMTAILYVAFAIIAWNGHRTWRRDYRESLIGTST